MARAGLYRRRYQVCRGIMPAASATGRVPEAGYTPGTPLSIPPCSDRRWKYSASATTRHRLPTGS